MAPLLSHQIRLNAPREVMRRSWPLSIRGNLILQKRSQRSHAESLRGTSRLIGVSVERSPKVSAVHWKIFWRLKACKVRVALVTGSARRIGRHIAVGLGAAGYAIGVHYNTSRHEADVVTSKIDRAVALSADLATWDAPEALITACEDRLGSVDVLVNCASTFDYDDLGDLDPKVYHHNIAINLTAPVNLIRAVARRRRPAVVINFLDFKVWRPSESFLSYTLAKTALKNATIMLAQALAPTVRVNAIAPGVVLQSGNQSLSEYQAMIRSTLLERKIDLDDILRAVCYLIDTESVTGEILYVDAGLRFQDYEEIEAAITAK